MPPAGSFRSPRANFKQGLTRELSNVTKSRLLPLDDICRDGLSC